MIVNLPEDLERYIEGRVELGRYASPDEALAAAVRLLRQREEAEEARALEGIRQGLEDMKAGRTATLEEFKEHVRRAHGIQV
jgi:putative addiction module CopG family antidote